MTVITGQVVDDDGFPIPGAYVSANLVASSRWLADRSGLVEGRADAYTGPDGEWSLDLPPASTLADEHGWWRVRVWGFGAFGVNVPDDPGRDVPVSTPGVLRPPEDDDTGPLPEGGRDDLPTGVGLVYVRDEVTGIYRLRPMDVVSGWGQPVRFAPDEPPIGQAPPGAVWVNTDSGAINTAT